MLFLFVFLHFREVKVEVLELNSIAPSYIVTQVDIDYYDEEATIILRQEAVKHIGKIYQVSEKLIRQRKSEFENFLIYSDEWRKGNVDNSFNAIHQSTDWLVKELTAARFTDPRTLKQIEELNFPTKNFQIFTPGDLETEVLLPPQIWNTLEQMVLLEAELPLEKPLKYVLPFFEHKKWLFEEDVSTERSIRKKLQDKVPDKYSHLNAGSRIIDQGERVSTRHVAMLQAMQKGLNEQRNLWHPLTLLGA